MTPTDHRDLKGTLRRFVVQHGLLGIIHHCLPTLLLGWAFSLRRLSPAFRRNRGNLAPYSILVVRLDHIGDVVLSSPLLRELRRLYPEAHITILVGSVARPLVEYCPHVDEVLDLPAGTKPFTSLIPDLRSTVAFCKSKLKRRFWDLVIVPRWDTDVYFATLMSTYTCADRRVAFSETGSYTKRRLNWGFDNLYTHLLPTGTPKHEVERNLDFVRYLGGDIAKTDLELWLTPSDRAYADACRADFGLGESDPVIAFGIGSSSKRTQWPASRFAELIDRMRSNLAFTPAIICGPEETGLAGEVRDHTSTKILVPAGPSIRQTAAFLSRCALFIGNDSGPLHLAAAAGIPVIEISCHPIGGDADGENSPDRFGPFTDKRIIVRPRQPKQPCRKNCVLQEPHCISEVSVAQVAKEVSILFEGHFKSCTCQAGSQ
jgi:ADP-heptose:LPS heptosyltransferase